jgi:hypothetical protein
VSITQIGNFIIQQRYTTIKGPDLADI